MVTPAISRRHRKKLETRARILETAVEIFSKRGIENATVEEIAHAADVGKGTICNYFPAKEDIVIAFLVEFERKVQAEAAQIVHRGRTLESVLTAFVLFQFKLKEPHHAFVRVFLTQMFARTSAFLPWMEQPQIVIDATLQQLFSRFGERGLLRADLDARTLIEVFKVMQLGLTSLWAIEGPPWLSDGTLQPNTMVSNDAEQTVQSLLALAERLRSRRAEIRHMCGHVAGGIVDELTGDVFAQWVLNLALRVARFV